MKTAILGAGAMGSIYAALFADAGHSVQVVDLWQAHIEAIRTTGLRVEGASGDRTVTTLAATTDLAALLPADLFIIATKAAGVESAAKAISGVMGADSLVLTIQNGLGAGERIAAHMPTDRVLLGVAEGFGASMKGPGHAHHNAMKRIRIGELTGGMTERLADLAETWRQAGFDVEAYDDIDKLIWEKFVCNVTYSAPCTAFDCTIGGLMGDPARWEVALGCAREAHALGKAQDIAFGFDDIDAYVTAFGGRMPDASPSMRLDHQVERRSEIDAINGMVSTLGRRLGIATPYNDCMSAVVRAREAQFK